MKSKNSLLKIELLFNVITILKIYPTIRLMDLPSEHYDRTVHSLSSSNLQQKKKNIQFEDHLVIYKC